MCECVRVRALYVFVRLDWAVCVFLGEGACVCVCQSVNVYERVCPMCS